MNIEIVSDSGGFFNIPPKSVEPIFPPNEEPLVVAPEDKVVQDPQPKAAPLENSREGHPFDFFGGTSWAGKRNSFD